MVTFLVATIVTHAGCTGPKDTIHGTLQGA